MTSKDWGMFSESGNAMIDAIVWCVKIDDTGWRGAYSKLVALSKIDGFGEATDTVVRELVFDAVAKSEEEFYL